MQSIVKDVLYGARLLRRSPGFTAAVALSLGLGIGANTAIFTLLDAVLWRSLPISEPKELLAVARQLGMDVFGGFNYAEYRALRESPAGGGVEGYATAAVNVSIDGTPEPSVQGELVSGGYFGLLGVRAVIGRAIGPEDDRIPDGHPVVMLSDGYWQRRFSRDPSVVGRTLRVSATPVTIIGVTPPGFFGVDVGRSPDIFMPLMMQPTVMPAFENLIENPIVNRTWIEAIARTTPGSSREQTAALLDASIRTLMLQQGTKPDSSTPRIVLDTTSAVSSLRRQFAQPLFMLLALVGVVLLIACANTANLLLARAAARRPEMAMRLALGAGRFAVVRQLLVESTLLAALGGACGVLLAGWATRALLLFMSIGQTPIVLDLTPNPRVLAFTAAVSIATGMLFGLAPAWRASRIELTPALKYVRGSFTRGLGPGRLLTTVQLALSLVLLVGAGLFAHSLQALTNEKSAVSRAQVVVLRVEPRGSDQRNIAGTTERLDRTYRELIRRTAEIPGVVSASMSNVMPTAPTPSAGAPVQLASGQRVRIPMVMVYPDYFSAIGVALASGRDFGSADLAATAGPVCIVNESFARQVYPGQDPLGKPCYSGTRARLQNSPSVGRSEAFAIIGVVQDSRYSNPRGEVQPLIYATFLQTGTGRGQMVLYARTSGAAGHVMQQIREAATAIDPTMPMFDVHTLDEDMGAALVEQRLVALLSTIFGALALTLACVGLYGLLAFAVVQRATEMGIRMALGARRADVVWMLLREAWTVVFIGLVGGCMLAFAAGRIAASRIEGFLFRVDATDPATIVAAALTLTAVATIAAYLPARRASRIDPMVALRES
jgi:predicted permease